MYISIQGGSQSSEADLVFSVQWDSACVEDVSCSVKKRVAGSGCLALQHKKCLFQNNQKAQFNLKCPQPFYY